MPSNVVKSITVSNGLVTGGSTLTVYSSDEVDALLAGVGTVTSVDASGGSTGLTVTGGPVTGSGTLTLDGTLVVGSGGTGATDAPTARSNLGLAAVGPSAYLATVSDGTYTLTAKAAYGWTINQLAGVKLAAGTCTI